MIKGKSALFIRVPKTASTSMEMVLREYSNVLLNSTAQLLSRENWPDNWIQRGLSNLWSDEIGKEVYEKLFTFSFVRNPYERACSSWLHVRNLSRAGQIVARDEFDCLKLKSPNVDTFDDFLGLLESGQLVGQALWHACPQCVHVSDASGEINVSFVGRFENLQRDFNFVLDQIGGARKNLPHLKKSNVTGFDYKSCYNRTRESIVENIYSADLELFEYGF